MGVGLGDEEDRDDQVGEESDTKDGGVDVPGCEGIS